MAGLQKYYELNIIMDRSNCSMRIVQLLLVGISIFGFMLGVSSVEPLTDETKKWSPSNSMDVDSQSLLIASGLRTITSTVFLIQSEIIELIF